MRRRLILLASLSLLGSIIHIDPARAHQATPVAGAGGNWPMDRANAARTGEAPGAGPLAQPLPLWRVTLPEEVRQ